MMFPNACQLKRNKISARIGPKFKRLSFPDIALGINAVISEYAGSIPLEMKQQILYRKVLNEIQQESYELDTLLFYECLYEGTSLQTLAFYKNNSACCFPAFTGRCSVCLMNAIRAYF